MKRVYTSYRTLPDEEAAKEAFEAARERMFHVNSWGKIPGPENADFILYDKEGPKTASPEVGDFIKTLLPGPLPENWVQITDIREEPDSASFTVHPSTDPTDENEPEIVTEHFFKGSARSTFKVERKGKVLKASESGINESINNQGPEAGDRKALNTMISEAGWAFVQELQWKNVTDYIVGNKEAKQ